VRSAREIFCRTGFLAETASARCAWIVNGHRGLPVRHARSRPRAGIARLLAQINPMRKARTPASSGDGGAERRHMFAPILQIKRIGSSGGL
jgi:hypothetical protein